MTLWVEVLSAPEPETGGSDVDHFRQATAEDITGEMVERAAQAIYAQQGYCDWEIGGTRRWQVKYRETAQVALAAALGQERRDG